MAASVWSRAKAAAKKDLEGANACDNKKIVTRYYVALRRKSAKKAARRHAPRKAARKGSSLWSKAKVAAREDLEGANACDNKRIVTRYYVALRRQMAKLAAGGRAPKKAARMAPSTGATGPALMKATRNFARLGRAASTSSKAKFAATKEAKKGASAFDINNIAKGLYNAIRRKAANQAPRKAAKAAGAPLRSTLRCTDKAAALLTPFAGKRASAVKRDPWLAQRALASPNETPISVAEANDVRGMLQYTEPAEVFLTERLRIMGKQEALAYLGAFEEAVLKGTDGYARRLRDSLP